MTNQKKPILITGCHRSGTTWVGKTIAESKDIVYIAEPFNPNLSSKGGIYHISFEHWFEYICQENQDKYSENISKMMNLSYNWNTAINKIKTIQDAKVYLGQYKNIIKHKIRGSRLLLKDPIAVFSAPWLANTFNLQVLVTIRHPIAFVGSLKKAERWNFEYQNFLDQPLLMENHLSAFKTQIEEYAQKKPTRIEHGILFWNIVHTLLSEYQAQYPDWIFVRHEDISANPVLEYEKIFNQLKLPYTNQIIDNINLSSNAKIKKDTQIGKQEVRRNSKKNMSNFKNRLNKEEIDKIKKETYNVCQLFYPEKHWDTFYQ